MYETIFVNVDRLILNKCGNYKQILTQDRADFINDFLNQKYEEGLELVSMTPAYDATGSFQEYSPIRDFYMVFKHQYKQNLID